MLPIPFFQAEAIPVRMAEKYNELKNAKKCILIPYFTEKPFFDDARA